MIAPTADAWFPEPSTPDETLGPRTEPLMDWLARSTSPNALHVRAFLKSLCNRWMAGLFELVVARTAQLLGAAVEIEMPDAAGKRLDVRATFLDGIVGIEATSPVIDVESGKVAIRRAPLLDDIESRVPEGWSVCVWELPTIGPNDSKREFRDAVTALVSEPPARVETERSMTVGGQPLSLTLRPVEPGYPRITLEPALTQFDQTKERIERAIASKKRRKQARAAHAPVLLAIHAGGISSRFEHFDRALFGQTVERIDRIFGSLGTRFEPDGVFAAVRPEPPTFAGVLAYTTVRFWHTAAPVLNIHPRFDGALPESLMRLERRELRPDRVGIEIKPSRVPDLLMQMQPISET